MKLSKGLISVAAVAALVVVLSGCGLRRHKYDNRITKDTVQPDKVLFDAAIDDIEHSRFQRARLTLQTLMNTYDTSEYMAKAKLAVADSWFREGGSMGFAQAEAEYKDFILFYPNMEEAAEAQVKVCKMQYQQMEKADRDQQHALRAEGECRQLLTQFPNSKFAPEAQQMLRNIQEVEAESEFKVGSFYRGRGTNYAAANRLEGVANQYPLYSKADEALWMLGGSYRAMGDRFENQQASAYTRIVRDYPMSPHVDEAKALLEQLKRPIPEADPVAMARMKYEMENQSSRSLIGKVWGPFSGKPNTLPAAKSGTPQMSGFRPTSPVSVPPAAAGPLGTSGEVTASVPSDPSAIDKNPDVRANPGAGAPAAGAPAAGSEAKPDAPGTADSTAAPADAKTSGANPQTAPAANKKSEKPPKPPKKKKGAAAAAAQSPAGDSATAKK